MGSPSGDHQLGCCTGLLRICLNTVHCSAAKGAACLAGRLGCLSLETACLLSWGVTQPHFHSRSFWQGQKDATSHFPGAVGPLAMLLQRMASTCGCSTRCHLQGCKASLTCMAVKCVSPPPPCHLCPARRHLVWQAGEAPVLTGTCLGGQACHDILCLQAPQEGTEWGTLTAAARLSEKASIGNGFWKTAHGGAVCLMSVLHVLAARRHLAW